MSGFSQSSSSSGPVCEAPEVSDAQLMSSVDQPYGNDAQQGGMSVDESAGGMSGAPNGPNASSAPPPPPNATPADDTTWWKTAPKLEIPWPPCSDKQSKHAIGWDGGPTYDFSFPEAKWPSNGKETLFEAPAIQVQTPVPGVVLDLFAKAEYGLSLGGSLAGSIQKTGDNKYKATGRGTVTGKAAIGVKGGVGLGLGGAGVSVGVSGNLAATLEAALSGSIQFDVTYDAGKWTGTLSAPLKFETAVKVTPSAALYVRVWEYNTELASLTFGEWTIASAGIQWTPGVRFAAGGPTNITTKPTVTGPRWGAPPEVKEA